MTDLEMTRLCAEAMGYYLMRPSASDHAWHTAEQDYYDPLHDDAQAMALVKKCDIHCEKIGSWWECEEPMGHLGTHSDLNRAICECVAKMQMARSSS